MTILITDEDCERLLSMKLAIPAIEEVFRLAGRGDVENPPRYRTPLAEGNEFQFGIARIHSRNVMGFKVGTPRTQRWNFLYKIEPNELLAIVQAKMLSKLRTGATTAVAVEYLSPATASVVGMYGTGRQAEAQLEAICEVRPIREAHVYGRNETNRNAFASKMCDKLGIKVVPVQAPEQVPRTADILVTMTSSKTPVLLGEWLTRPCLVVCVGANHTYEREIDESVVQRASLIVVDELQTAMAESGDLLYPAQRGSLRWGQVEELGDVIIGRAAVPDFSSGLIVFESHGLAMQDVAVAALAYEFACAQGIGRPIAL